MGRATSSTWVGWIGRRALAVAALATAGCAGIDAGVDYPDDNVDIDRFVATPENQSDPSVSFNSFKIRPEACQGIDTHPILQPLTQEDFARFLESQGAKIKPRKARTNLYWYDFPNGDGGFVRLRVSRGGDAFARSRRNIGRCPARAPQ